jgi:NADP-dependent 3-hydroxy acid dehydrogenase YdfG
MTSHEPVCLITGASRGLGRYTALCFAEAGYRVAVCGRTEKDLVGVARDIRDVGGWAMHAALDVRDYEAVTAFVRQVQDACGRIDVLVNNAGLLSVYRPLAEWTREQMDETLDVNLKGTMYASRAVLPGMIARGRGHIINVASDVGRRPVANMAPYVAAKHAIVGFSGSLYREVREQGIKVTVVLPGNIDTFFGGAKPGDRDLHWSLKPEDVADVLLSIARQPGNLAQDEVILHALGQEI